MELEDETECILSEFDHEFTSNAPGQQRSAQIFNSLRALYQHHIDGHPEHDHFEWSTDGMAMQSTPSAVAQVVDGGDGGNDAAKVLDS